MAFGSLKGFVDPVGCSYEMTTLAVDYRTVTIGKFHGMVIVYLSIIFTSTPCPTAGTLNGYRVTSFYPICNIDLMHVLFNNMVAAKPVEIIPISHLVFHFCLARGAGTDPHATAVPVNLPGYNIAHVAVIHSVYGI